MYGWGKGLLRSEMYTRDRVACYWVLEACGCKGDGACFVNAEAGPGGCCKRYVYLHERKRQRAHMFEQSVLRCVNYGATFDRWRCYCLCFTV